LNSSVVLLVFVGFSDIMEYYLQLKTYYFK